MSHSSYVYRGPPLDIRTSGVSVLGGRPGLQRAYDDATAAFDTLVAEHPVEFHAAYIANLEATFTPMFKVALDNRDSLFEGPTSGSPH
jgi:hypothetical protein